MRKAAVWQSNSGKVGGGVNSLGSVGLPAVADAGALAELEAELARQQETVRVARGRFEAQRRRELHGEAEKLGARVKELSDEVESERRSRLELMEGLREKREEDGKIVSQLDGVSARVWDMERGHRLEDAALLHLLAENTRSERETLDRMIENHGITIEGIAEERQRRAADTEQVLQERLWGKDALSAGLNDMFGATERQDLAARMFEKGGENNVEGEAGGGGSSSGARRNFRLSDEIIRARQRKLKGDDLARKQRMRELNEQRAGVHREQMALAKKKKQVRSLNDKGLEFLVGIEWGDAPPVDFILKNIEAQQAEAKRAEREERTRRRREHEGGEGGEGGGGRGGERGEGKHEGGGAGDGSSGDEGGGSGSGSDDSEWDSMDGGADGAGGGAFHGGLGGQHGTEIQR